MFGSANITVGDFTGRTVDGSPAATALALIVDPATDTMSVAELQNLPATSGVVLQDGTAELTADWDAGSHQIRAETFQSDVATGTAPLIVSSGTLVSNLNADLLDGQEGSYYATAASVTAITSGYNRRKKVIDRVDNTAAPPTEVSGDRYLLDDTGASHANWDGAAINQIVEFDGVAWVTTAPDEGWIVYNDTTDTDWLYVDDGSPAWQERTAGGGGGGLTATAQTTGYTAAADDLVVCDSTGGAFSVTMPTSPGTDDRIGIYVEDGNSSEPVTVSGNGKTLAEFGSAVTMQTPGDLLVFHYDGTKWVIEANGLQIESLELLTAADIDEDDDFARLGDGSATEDFEKRATVKSMLAPYRESDSVAGTAAGDEVYRPASNDHWTNLAIGNPNDQKEVRDGFGTWQPRMDTSLARVVATSNVTKGSWDISTGSYASKSMSVTAQESNCSSLAFSSDGLKCYVVGTTSDTVYQYTLSTAWDISTGSYASKSMSVSAEETSPEGLAFSSDGTKCYVVGTANAAVYQYTLSTAWDISTGSYASKSMSVSVEETSPAGLAFSVDGTKAYVMGHTADAVYQYTLSTAWDISTGSYASKSMSVVSQETIGLGLALSADGTKCYVVGNSNDTVYQYTLSTAWDISTGSYASKSMSVAAQETYPKGLAFSPNGAAVFVVGKTSDTVFQYSLSGTDPSPVDGVTLADDDRVLLSGQTDASENGVWLAVTADDPATWTRVADMAAAGSASGRMVAVTAGTNYSPTLWICDTAAGSDVVGTDDLTFTQYV